LIVVQVRALGYASIQASIGGSNGGLVMSGIRTRNRLKALTVARERRAGIYSDGGGLSLVVTDAGVKRWELRTSVHGRRRQLGLGVYPDVSLEEARRNAIEIRTAAKQGLDLVADRRRLSRLAVKDPLCLTFKQAFGSYFELKEQELSNGKHRAQWRSTMDTYVFPVIGQRPVADVTPAEVIDILKPIWSTKRETARRVLQRMRNVFEAAIVRGERDRASPTTGITAVLGSRQRKVEHHAAMPFVEVPTFVARLRTLGGRRATGLAFEFLILTAARSGEVRLATWDEIDARAALWTVPAARMKSRAVHVVPLTSRALAILSEARAAYPNSQLVFPGAKPGLPLSDMTLTKVLRDTGLGGQATAHGFRSSFKDWCVHRHR
jgi:integrase